jgi:hypothetical protein
LRALFAVAARPPFLAPGQGKVWGTAAALRGGRIYWSGEKNSRAPLQKSVQRHRSAGACRAQRCLEGGGKHSGSADRARA